MSKKPQATVLNIEIRNGQRIIIVKDNETIVKIEKAKTMKEKRKIVEKYLSDNFVGRTLTKEYIDK